MWRPAVSQLVNSVEAAAGSPGPGRGQPRRRPEFSLGWMHTGVHECPDGRTVRTDFWIVIMSGRWLNTISERDVSVIDRVYRFLKKHNLTSEARRKPFLFRRLSIRMKSFEPPGLSAEQFHTPCPLCPEKRHWGHGWAWGSPAFDTVSRAPYPALQAGCTPVETCSPLQVHQAPWKWLYLLSWLLWLKMPNLFMTLTWTSRQNSAWEDSPAVS